MNFFEEKANQLIDRTCYDEWDWIISFQSWWGYVQVSIVPTPSSTPQMIPGRSLMWELIRSLVSWKEGNRSRGVVKSDYVSKSCEWAISQEQKQFIDKFNRAFLILLQRSQDVATYLSFPHSSNAGTDWAGKKDSKFNAKPIPRHGLIYDPQQLLKLLWLTGTTGSFGSSDASQMI